ncbi:MAG: methyltransferase [Tistrella sp.]|uniref:Methyltransferase n=1 Tax=Tistrella mobilis TaxID=171437 RepID=A0A3B9IQF6_9PROT|nr:class I SAM-dependent methyltransferase [Tistrella sp.]MAD40434.1 methyltransferase [Tistrella sp.]MBA74007.1 methyltransferase [Tistrella sp.]HAE50035.1 methyltransferase [Tistrella mobilis]
MSTLTTAPVAPLLDRLFTEAAAAEIPPALARLSAEERDRLMRSRSLYRDLYHGLAEVALPVSPTTGRLLYMLAYSLKAQTIVEFGTSFGISTLHLAAALRDTAGADGAGRIITTEFEPAKAARARDNLRAAGLADLVELREGDALETLARDLPPVIDLVLLDGAKVLYAEILALIEPHLRPGALVVADNAEHAPDYLARIRDPANGWLSVPFGGDVELSMRLG